MLYRLTYRSVLWRHFSDWDPFFPDDSSLWQVDKLYNSVHYYFCSCLHVQKPYFFVSVFIYSYCWKSDVSNMSWDHSEKQTTPSHTACAFAIGNCLLRSFEAWFCKACVCYDAVTNACAECPNEGMDILSGPTSLPALLQCISRTSEGYAVF